MDIRKATADDVPTVRSLAREAWTAAYADAVPESVVEDAVSEWYAEETMNRVIGDDEQVCLVAVDESEARSVSGNKATGVSENQRFSGCGESSIRNSSTEERSESVGASKDASGERNKPRAGEIVGFSHGATDEEDGDVLRLYVHPDRWHEGIGTALLDAVEERLRGMGAERVQAMVLADNEMGNAFYEEQGFEKTGEAETQLDGTTRTENVYAEAY